MNVPFPNYSSSNDQSLASLSTLPYQQGSEQTSCHLPPPQPTRGGLAYPHDLANYSSRPIDSSFPTALPTSTTPFSQNAYGSQVSSRHGLLQPSYSQSAHQFPIVQDLHHPTSPLSYQPPHGLQAQGRLPELLPMPIGGLTQSSGTSTNSMYSFSSASTNAHHEPPPTHVVGSQGRRGILPSAAGRPPAVSNGGVPNVKTSTLPAKDADGKFPCPHCSKTYLHAKHLKRHLLRHTGDRPYMCILCKDTFSRSDILKRHFQKCSVRRGNPTGATHLSHSQAHTRKLPVSQKKAPLSDMHEIDISTQNQLPDLSTTLNPEAHFSNALSPSLGLSGYSGPQTSWSTPVSRSNSNKRRESANVVRDNRRSLTALGALSLDRPNVGLSHTRPGATSVSSSTASTPLSSSQSSYANQFSQLIKPDQINSTNGLHADTSSNDSAFIHGLSRMQGLSHGAGDGFDWPDQFQSGSKEDNLSSLFQPPVRSGRGQVKGESESAHVSYGSATDGRHDDLINGIFDSGSASPVTDGVSDDFHSWSLDQSQIDPLEGKVRHLTNFCFPDRQSSVYANDAETQALRYSLTVDNVRHFLDRFSNFQCHWPIIHMPTFDAVKTYDGLILAMMCIGAVYSNRMNVAQVRALVRGTLKAMEQKSSVFEFLKHATISMSGRDMDEYKTAHIEELQALILLLTLSVWHGDSAQRDSARADFAQCSLLVRKLGLLRPACSHCPIYSILHQPSSAVDQASPTDWNWNAWIGQEKLSRLMYAFFLTDAALVIYFNCDPHFNPAEITLPLPADDAPWEAKTADTCASALGLYGPAAQSGNTTGSRRQKQPEMAKAMKALLHPTYEFQARSTNTYAKFILVHALHVQIWITLKQISLGHSYHGLGDLGYLTNGNTTPISQNDWVTRVDRSGNTSRSSSGQITPTDSSGAQSPDTHQMLKSATNALQKWKRMWDEDMTLQYPHSASASRRLGFCRDGIHFYWLARLFLRNPRAGLWRTPPDSRFVHVLHLLKQVRAWVASENAVRGEEIGSVSEIDDSYGMEGLTLDMKLLFTPLT